MQKTQENMKESFIRRFLNNLGNIDVADSENNEYEKTLEFSNLSENDKIELQKAQASINEGDVNYAGEIRKLNKHNLFNKEVPQDGFNSKESKMSKKEQEIADYYSQPNKSEKKNREKEEIEK